MSVHSSKGPAWEALRKTVISNYGGVCVKCGNEANHVDHILPKAIGGEDSLENLQLLCAKCNTTKGARLEGKRVTWFHSYWFSNESNNQVNESHQGWDDIAPS